MDRSRVGRLGEVGAASLRLGLTSFGGPVAHIAYFRREYVERRGWLDEATFADLVAMCQALPGPASSQLGIAIGTRRAGMAGGLVSWLGFTAPSAIAMIALGVLATSVDLSSAGWVHGLKVAAVAIVAQAVYLMARTLAPDMARRLLALAAAAVVLALPSTYVQSAVIVAGAVIGWLVLRPATARIGRVRQSRVPRRVGIVALGAFWVLLVGLPVIAIAGGATVAFVDAFFRAGALVFGGGHVVLPLLADGVVTPGWVSDGAFVSGYGAVQAMPGPLFTFAGYLGAVATVPPGGVAGGLIAVLAIFLPAFLLVWGTLPFWDSWREAVAFRQALVGINAAVVGLLLAALYSPVWTSAIEAPIDAVVAAAGFAALLTGRVPPLAVVAGSALVGQVLVAL